MNEIRYQSAKKFFVNNSQKQTLICPVVPRDLSIVYQKSFMTKIKSNFAIKLIYGY